MHAAGWQIPNQVGALVFIVIERNPNDRKIERLLLAEGFLYVREQRGNRVWVNPQYERQMADRERRALFFPSLSSPRSQKPKLVDLPNALLGEPAAEYSELSKDLLVGSFCSPNAYKAKCGETNFKEAACTDAAVRRKLCVNSQSLFKVIDTRSNSEVSSATKICKRLGFAPCKFYSHQHEDAVLYNMYFQQKKGGVFLDLGGFADGENSRFFEQTMGWTGVLVEASPPSFQALNKLRCQGKANRNKCVHAARCMLKRAECDLHKWS
jgi:hypothetical protein